MHDFSSPRGSPGHPRRRLGFPGLRGRRTALLLRNWITGSAPGPAVDCGIPQRKKCQPLGPRSGTSFGLRVAACSLTSGPSRCAFLGGEEGSARPQPAESRVLARVAPGEEGSRATASRLMAYCLSRSESPLCFGSTVGKPSTFSKVLSSEVAGRGANRDVVFVADQWPLRAVNEPARSGLGCSGTQKGSQVRNPVAPIPLRGEGRRRSADERPSPFGRGRGPPQPRLRSKKHVDRAFVACVPAASRARPLERNGPLRTWLRGGPAPGRL